MNFQAILAIGLVLIVSFNVSSAQITKRTNVTTGARKAGDKLLDTKSDSDSFSTPKDVTKLVTYDTKGPKLTQVTFDVETNSNINPTATVISGGIGQKQIGIELKAKGVTTFKYTVYVYGNSAALMPSLGLIASLAAYIIFVNKQ